MILTKGTSDVKDLKSAGKIFNVRRKPVLRVFLHLKRERAESARLVQERARSSIKLSQPVDWGEPCAVVSSHLKFNVQEREVKFPKKRRFNSGDLFFLVRAKVRAKITA